MLKKALSTVAVAAITMSAGLAAAAGGPGWQYTGRPHSFGEADGAAASWRATRMREGEGAAHPYEIWSEIKFQ